MYAQVHNHGFLPVDDSIYVKDNPRVQAGLSVSNIGWALTTMTAANWHPITWLSHMLDCQIFGLRPGGYHLVNVFFHVLNVLLLFWVLERMTARNGRGAVWPSAFVAAVFAVHPLHVESVAWIAERKDVLSTAFWLLTMAAYAAYVRKSGLHRYLLVVLLFGLGLMAKPMLVTLPCVLLLLDFWPLGRFARPASVKGKTVARFPWMVLVDKVPLFGLAAFSSVMTYHAQYHSGAVQTFDMLPLQERAANAALAYVHYLAHALWPVHLSTYYPLPKIAPSWWSAAGALTLLAGISGVVVWRRRSRPYLVAGWFWFLGTLAPVIGLIQVGPQVMADRYMYVPLIGLAIMAAWGVPALIPHVRHRTSGLAAACVCTILVLGALCWVQLSYWGDNIALYRHEAGLRPDSAFAHYHLAVALHHADRIDEAEQEFRKAVELKPHHVDANIYLGLIAYGRKHYEEAVQYYVAALERAMGHRNRAEAEINLGAALAELGRNEEAARHFETGLQVEPGLPEGHYSLANALAALGRRDEAAEHYREALRLRPDYAYAQARLRALLAAGPVSSPNDSEPELETAEDYYEYGNRLAEKNQFGEAAEQYRAALKLNPRDVNARVNLGNALAAMAKPREALAQFQEALAVKPDDTVALTNAGNVLVELGQYSEACEEYRKALVINPRQTNALCGLGQALAKLEQFDEAKQAFSKALIFDPANRLAQNGLNDVARKQTGALQESHAPNAVHKPR